MSRNRLALYLLFALFSLKLAGCSAAGSGSSAPPAHTSDGTGEAPANAAGGSSLRNGSGGSASAAESSGGATFGVQPDGGGGQERCTMAGSTRSCCRFGTQTCGNGELPVWG